MPKDKDKDKGILLHKKIQRNDKDHAVGIQAKHLFKLLGSVSKLLSYSTVKHFYLESMHCFKQACNTKCGHTLL